ncbi:Bride of doubletime [Carabus blaptoides fortunei]
MSDEYTWTSPDNRIKKKTLRSGVFGTKPTENTICTIEITYVKWESEPIQTEYVAKRSHYPLSINIGEANTALDREVEKCPQTMHLDELSSFAICFEDCELSFVLKLCHFESRGYIYEWDAKDKCLIAQRHKEKGVELFQKRRYIDASHRFSRGLKLLLSIPIPVDEALTEVDGVNVSELANFKKKLYNNLASCYTRNKSYDTVIDLCTKVLEIDKTNVNAFYKRGVAYAGIRNFEKSKEDLETVLAMDNENKVAKEKLQYVMTNIQKQEANYACMVKKMFGK